MYTHFIHIKFIYVYMYTHIYSHTLTWPSQLGKTPRPMRVPDMTLNNLMVRFQ